MAASSLSRGLVSLARTRYRRRNLTKLTLPAALTKTRHYGDDPRQSGRNQSGRISGRTSSRRNSRRSLSCNRSWLARRNGELATAFAIYGVRRRHCRRAGRRSEERRVGKGGERG